MEGEKRPGQEVFSDFLISLASSYSAFPQEYAEVLGLYIKLSYGDPGILRAIPFDLAKSQGLFSKEVVALRIEAARKTEEDRQAFRARFIPDEEEKRAYWRMQERERKTRDRLEILERKIRSAKASCGDIWHPANVYTWYIWLRLFAEIEELVIPYRTAEFTQTWQYLMTEGQAAKTISKIDESLKLVKYPGYGCERYMPYMKPRVVRDLKDFLHAFQEGALVMLALLDCAGKGGWMGRQDHDISSTDFPGIEGKDPVDTWCLVERIRVVMHNALRNGWFSSVFAKYLDNEFVHYYSDRDDDLKHAGFQTFISSYTMCDDIKYRNDVQSLETLLNERWGWFVRNHSASGEWWKKLIGQQQARVVEHFVR